MTHGDRVEMSIYAYAHAFAAARFVGSSAFVLAFSFELCLLHDFHNLTSLPVKTSDVRECAGNFGATQRPGKHQER